MTPAKLHTIQEASAASGAIVLATKLPGRGPTLLPDPSLSALDPLAHEALLTEQSGTTRWMAQLSS